MRTSCEITMDLSDVTAISDGVISFSGNAACCNAALLKEKADYSRYAMCGFLLDGRCQIVPDGMTFPFVSGESLEDMAFPEETAVNISFNKNHTSAGITLYFADDYPETVRTIWYDKNGIKLADRQYHPDQVEFFCKNQVENFDRIEIRFEKTKLPMQRTILEYIRYGLEIKWNSSNIMKAELVEETDITGASLPICTANVKILDLDGAFCLTNKNGIWRSIQREQLAKITEYVNGMRIDCGEFYLDSWEVEEKAVSFSFVDKIGILDKTKFYNGRMYQDEKVADIISDVMQSAGVDDYHVDDEIADIALSGYINICTHREALQQVVFACGAVVDSKKELRIRSPKRTVGQTIGPDRSFMGMKMELDEYVSGVAVSYVKYTRQQEEKEIYKDMLQQGDTLIEFTEPYESVEISGGSLLESKTNYAVVRMEESGECILKGYGYDKKEMVYTAALDKAEAGEDEKIVSYNGCTLLNAERAKKVADKLLKHHKLRQVVSMRYLLESEHAGEWVSIRDCENGTYITGITSQSIDLTGGFIATATCRGYSQEVTSPAYTGEIYAGERSLI